MKEAFKKLIRYHKIKAWYEKYERFLLPATLLVGVLVDFFTFTNIDIVTSLIILAVYVTVVGGAILFMNAYDAKPFGGRVFQYLRLAIMLIIQFLFGALLSGVFVFYFFSGTIFVSWPFIVILIGLMISNELFRRYYTQPVVQVSMYFFVLFSFVSVSASFILNSLSPWVFAGAGVASLAIIFLYVFLLTRLSSHVKRLWKQISISILSIFSVINGFYFLNIIPPIPLSLREVTLAHDLVRNNSGYTLQVEPESWFDQIMPGQIFHKQANEKVFLYTSIFAPGDLSTTIVHHWQKYDEVKQEWVSHNRLSFLVSGGRKEGFRGYSVKSNVPAGSWRVDVETERGQVLGRVGFEVVNVVEVPELENIQK